MTFETSHSKLRKAIYNKQMLRNKYEKYHTDKTWEAYRKQRNLVTKLKKDISISVTLSQDSFKRRILSKSLTYASTSKFLKLP
jgi:hypothetical protein